MENFKKWMFSTKAGRCLFIIVFDFIVIGFIASVTTIEFVPMMLGGVACAIVLSVFDGNDRWY